MPGWKAVSGEVVLALFSEMRAAQPPKANDPRRSIFSGMSMSGVRVTADSALAISAFFACTHIISETLATLPIKVFERQAGGKRVAYDHYLYDLLHSEPNPEMSAVSFFEAHAFQTAALGNGIAEIELNGDGTVKYLWPIRTNRVTPKRDLDGSLVYEVRLPHSGEKRYLRAHQVFHTKWLSWDGIWGMKPTDVLKNTLGKAMAIEEFEAKYFQNGAALNVVFTSPGELSDGAYERLKNSLQEKYVGLNNAHRIALLEEGMDAKKLGGTAEDAQLVDLRNLQAHDILRAYRMQPHKAQFMASSTNNNIEHQGIEFSTDTIRPWAVRYEQEFSRSLFLRSERKRFLAEINLDALMRGDILSRTQANQIQWMHGSLTNDEWRALENRNELPDGAGKKTWVPVNMRPADEPIGQGGAGSGQQSAVSGQRSGGSGQRGAVSKPELRAAADYPHQRQRLQQSYRSVYRDAIQRILRREGRDVVAGAKKVLVPKGRGAFDAWLYDFYRQKHDDSVRRDIAPVMSGYGLAVAGTAQEEVDEPSGMTKRLENWIAAYEDDFVNRHRGLSLKRINWALDQAVEDEQDPIEALDEEAAYWEETRSDEIALEESVQFGNGITLAVFSAAGVGKLRWVTHGDSCPYCKKLDGMIVGISEWFLTAGSELPGEDGKTLPITRNKRHAPAHKGCDCGIAAAW